MFSKETQNYVRFPFFFDLFLYFLSISFLRPLWTASYKCRSWVYRSAWDRSIGYWRRNKKSSTRSTRKISHKNVQYPPIRRARFLHHFRRYVQGANGKCWFKIGHVKWSKWYFPQWWKYYQNSWHDFEDRKLPEWR